MLSDKEAGRRMGLRAYEMCVKTFNWQAEAKNLVKAYEALAPKL